MRRGAYTWALVLAVTAITLVLGATARAGTTIAVTNPNDTFLPTDPLCSLREAIQAANTDQPFGGCPAGSGADTILLEPITYTLAIAPGLSDDDATTGNASGDLNIEGNLTIESTAPGHTTVDANHIDRIFDIRSGTVTISGLTLTNGRAPDGTGSGQGSGGGAILDGGALTLDADTVENSQAGNGANGGMPGIDADAGGDGGGVAVTGGTLTLQNGDTFTNDAAGTGGTNGNGGYGGAIFVRVDGTLTADSATFSSNRAGSAGSSGVAGDGGAIASATGGSISHSTFTGNLTGAGSGFNGGTDASGGAIWANASLSLDHDTFSDNATHDGLPGGGTGGQSGDGGAVFTLSGTLTVDQSTFTSNATGSGGASNGGSTGGASGSGGAIFASSTATISASTFTSNATGAGGNASGLLGGASGDGGAISAHGKLTLQGSTLSVNSTGAPGTGTPAGATGKGAAVAIDDSGGTESLINDTLTQNGVTGRSTGAVIYLSAGSELLDALTLARNQAPGVGGLPTAQIAMADDLLAANSPTNCNAAVTGSITDAGNNLSAPSNTGCPNTFLVGGPKIAGGLADNGGPTQTIALLNGSAAIDAGPQLAGGTCPATDQRGMPRPQGAACDIGAFEAGAIAIAITTPVEGATYTEGQAVAASYSCSEPGGITSIASCSGPVPSGSPIDTSTLGTHTFTVNAADTAGLTASKSVTYTVSSPPPPPRQTLTVTFAGDGHGTVTGTGGLTCSQTCSKSYLRGTAVTLTATPAAGSTFGGFSGGGCTGTSACQVTLTGDESVTVTFTAASQPPPPPGGSPPPPNPPAGSPPPPPPPNTRITKHKIGTTTARFRFKGSGGTGKRRFKCRLDHHKFKPCRSPKAYRHLKPGTRHTFYVEAIDASGQVDPTPAKRRFKLHKR